MTSEGGNAQNDREQRKAVPAHLMSPRYSLDAQRSNRFNSFTH